MRETRCAAFPQRSGWGHGSLTYALCTTTEELLEMLGIVVFIYALLLYLTQGGRQVRLALGITAGA